VLTELTEQEQKVHDELQSIFQQRATDESKVDYQLVIDKKEEFDAIEERFQKLILLRKPM
jgi:hypothetical protein